MRDLPIRDYDNEPDPWVWEEADYSCLLCGEKGYVQTRTTESSCGGFDNYYHRCAACSGNWKSGDGPDA